MQRGTVKWFNPQKGFGFITGEDGKDYFVHYTAIVMNGYKCLVDGDEVTFDVETEEKGLKAINVQPVK